jgi:hypothetical protein
VDDGARLKVHLDAGKPEPERELEVFPDSPGGVESSGGLDERAAKAEVA